MILADMDILEMISEGRLVIKEFNVEQLGPCSYDVRLGNKIMMYNKIEEIYDFGKKHKTIEYELKNGDRFIVCPSWMQLSDDEKEELCKKYDCVVVFDGAVLGLTNEYVELPNDICAWYQGRSSLGRLFLTSHQTAGYIDAGFKGRIVLEIVAEDRPVILEVGMKIGQLIFCKMSGECMVGYSDREVSKYRNQLDILPFIPDNR